jgi:hypothetical protein
MIVSLSPVMAIAMVIIALLAFALGTFLLVRAWADRKITAWTKLWKSAGALTLIAFACYLGDWKKAPEMIRPSMHRRCSITQVGQAIHAYQLRRSQN